MNNNKLSKIKFPWVFFILAYVISYVILYISLMLSKDFFTNMNLKNMVLGTLSGSGPSIAAFILVYRQDGFKGMKDLFLRAFKFKVSFKWFLISVLTMPILTAITYFVSYYILRLGEAPRLEMLSQPIGLIPLFILAYLTGGTFQEEYGWRGYALDRIQVKYSAFVSSLVIGIIWALWHLPTFFISGNTHSTMSLWIFICFTVLGSVILTWIYNNTNGNLFLCMMYHAMLNYVYAICPILNLGLAVNIVNLIVMFIFVGVIIAIWGADTLAGKSKTNTAQISQDTTI